MLDFYPPRAAVHAALAGTALIGALDPQGRFVIIPVVVNKYNEQWDTTSWPPCPGGDAASYPNIRCRVNTLNEISTVRTELFRISLSTGAYQVLSSTGLSAGEAPFFLSVDERGQEIAMQVATATADPVDYEFTTCSNAMYQWRTLPSSGALSPARSDVAVSGMEFCNGYQWGGVSALRMRGASSLRRRNP